MMFSAVYYGRLFFISGVIRLLIILFILIAPPVNFYSDYRLSAGYNGRIRKSKNDAKNSTGKCHLRRAFSEFNDSVSDDNLQYEKDVTDLTVTDNRAGIKPGQVMTGSGFPVRAGYC
ncbi:TPA: hypothetical protein ACYSAQ_002731 [Morganella morganii]|nr:hypothetical protein [Morganella morganii]